MGNFWNIVSGAPWWVYVLFVYLVSIGIQATKPRTLSIKKVVVLPVVFVVWGLYSLYTKVDLGHSSLIPVWFIGLGLGAYLGMKEVRSWHLSTNRDKGEITIPGNYSTLVLIVLIFVLKFFWGAYYATHTDISYWMYFTETATTSLVTGFFVGRAGFFCWSYWKKL